MHACKITSVAVCVLYDMVFAGNLAFQVTSSASTFDNFKTATATLPILTPQQCSLRNPPSPSPSPVPSPSPSPDPSQTLVEVSTPPLDPSVQNLSEVDTAGTSRVTPTVVLPSVGTISTGSATAAAAAPVTQVDMSGATDSDLQLLGQIAAANNKTVSSLSGETNGPVETAKTASARSGAGGLPVFGALSSVLATFLLCCVVGW